MYAILVSADIRNKCTGFFTQISNKQRSIRGGESWKIKKILRKIRSVAAHAILRPFGFR